MVRIMSYSVLSALVLWISVVSQVFADPTWCQPVTPVQGAAPLVPLPLFPADNWWNTDIRTAPVDPGSANYIAFINNGGTRKLHPDFGGEVSPGSAAIYGIPYAIVNGAQPKQAVNFQYWGESDGVDLTTGQSFPFYTIPTEAITQTHWIEGGERGDSDQRSQNDRHLLMIDCTNNALYELYNVFYNTAEAKWYAGSGAFFDMNTNNRRPDGWTSADAAGLAILPGLVRYDEAWNSNVTDIGHALRVTVRATNGYVYPASHRAGSTAGALPMGARLRLKTNVGGVDPATRTSDPNAQKIFRAMQTYGLIVADNGTDMYISGTFDVRWNNDILNPAFATLTAIDFEVVQLGWKPDTGTTPTLSSVSANPATLVGGNASTGTVALTGAAPQGGAYITLVSAASPAVTVPGSMTIAQGAGSATFPITTQVVSGSTAGTLAATYSGVTQYTTVTVNPPPAPTLSSLTLSPTSVVGGVIVTGTVTLSAPAPVGGAVVTLMSSNTALATVPANVTVPADAASQTYGITTKKTSKNTTVTLSANYVDVTKTASLLVKRR